MRFAPLLLSGCIFVTTPGTNDPTTTPDECDTVIADLESELADLQSCEENSDCGLVLTGTSCGCTRDLVAREDGDRTAFDDLLEEASDLECGYGFDSVCDCPEAAGFRCDEGTCAWNYVSDYPHLPVCHADEGDAYTIDGASLDGGELVVDLEFSGGCASHQFTLCWPDQSFQESLPVQASFELFHDDGDDACDGLLTEERRFSLTPLIDAYEESYGSRTGEITINVGDEALSFTF